MNEVKKLLLRLFRRDRAYVVISLNAHGTMKPDDEVQTPFKEPSESFLRVAHPHNVPGPFYSENEGCITCGAPKAAAPDLVGWHEERCGETTSRHCIFYRRPETREELDQAVMAMNVSCVENLRYRGTDPVVLKRLRRLGLGHLCDALDRWGVTATCGDFDD
jgi:hypothetical protein